MRIRAQKVIAPATVSPRGIAQIGRAPRILILADPGLCGEDRRFKPCPLHYEQTLYQLISSGETLKLLDHIAEHPLCLNCQRPVGMWRSCEAPKFSWAPDYDPHNDPKLLRHENGYAACMNGTGQFAQPGGHYVVTLCGSTRFFYAFQRANYEFTLAGVIILTVGFFPHATKQVHGEDVGVTPDQKVALDALHKNKIDMSHAIYVLNVDDYIGESTRNEIIHARTKFRDVFYLTDENETDRTRIAGTKAPTPHNINTEAIQVQMLPPKTYEQGFEEGLRAGFQRGEEAGRRGRR